MNKFLLNKKIIHLVATTVFVIAAITLPQPARAFEETDLFPFQYHLTYPNFKSDLNKISQFVSGFCKLNDATLDPKVKSAYLGTCAFPQLLDLLHQNAKIADQMFANRTIITRRKAQFIDIEFGWVYQDPYTLADRPANSLLNIILIQRALQSSVQSMEQLWLAQSPLESLTARFFLLPEFAAGLERDVILARDLEYARTIRCLNQPTVVENQCIDRRTALSQALNEMLSEYQSRPISVDLRIKPFADASQRFRALLATWLNSHNSANSILDALLHPDSSLLKLRNTYSQLVQISKRVRSPTINRIVAAYDYQRYIAEQSSVNLIYRDWLVKNDPQLTPDIIAILAHARKQLDLYYNQ